MFVLIIIGIVLLIVAIVNWGQSEGFFHKFKNFIINGSFSDDSSVQHRYVSGAGGVGIVDGDDIQDVTYADQSDYFDYREDE